VAHGVIIIEGVEGCVEGIKTGWLCGLWCSVKRATTTLIMIQRLQGAVFFHGRSVVTSYHLIKRIRGYSLNADDRVEMWPLLSPM
jgi:hypothetical protein